MSLGRHKPWDRSASVKRYREKRKREALESGTFNSLDASRPSGGDPRETPRRRSTLDRSGPIKPVSSKRARENRQRAAMLREKYGPAPVLCERCRQAEATDPHEIVPRSKLGSITDPENVRAICRDCHIWIHANPEAAKAEGWLA